MLGIIVALLVAVILPGVGLVYAIVRKRWLPFMLGILAFTISQLILRIPLLNILEAKSTTYLTLQLTNPIVFSFVLAFSASLFENTFRYVFMRLFMRFRDWTSGFLFGLGHGVVEAFAFVGIQAVIALFSPVDQMIFGQMYMLGGVERFFAILFHIGISIIILHSVVERKIIYFFLALFLHTFLDFLVGVLPLYFEAKTAIIIVELSLALIASGIILYSVHIKRKGILS